MKESGPDSDSHLDSLLQEKASLLMKIDQLHSEIDGYKMRAVWGQLKEQRQMAERAAVANA